MHYNTGLRADTSGGIEEIESADIQVGFHQFSTLWKEIICEQSW